jgi:hypothetical protein
MPSSDQSPEPASIMSPMAVTTLVIASVCTTLLIVAAIVDAVVATDLPWLRDIGSLFRAGACVGWVAFVLVRVRDGLLPAMERAHGETRAQVDKNHRETREHVGAVMAEVAVVADRSDQLRELVNALILHIDEFGDAKETDGRIAAMRELASKTNGATHPRPLRPAGPVSH